MKLGTKRFILLTLIALCAVLYACGKSQENQITDPSATSQTEATDAPSATSEPVITPYEEQGIIKFSHSGGIYTEEFYLTMEAPAGYTIHYTTTGTIPTKDSPIYKSPVWISNNESCEAGILTKTLSATQGAAYPKDMMPAGTVIRAVAINDATGEATDVETNTYMVWSEGADLYGCPILSLTVDKRDLAGAEGVYVKYSLLSKPKAVSYCEAFDETGMKRSGSYITIAVSGNGSSGFLQKSLKLSWKKDANPDVEDNTGKLDYDIFNGSVHDVNGNTITSFKRLLIRNSGNDCTGSFIRDRVVQKCSEGLATSYMEGQTVIVFINGELWGAYNLRERYSQQYFSAHFGVDKDNVVMLEAPSPLITGNGNSPYEVNDGEPGDEEDWNDLVAYIENHDMKNVAYYTNVLERLDIDGLIDNFIVNIYFYNGDWPTNNIKVWRNKNSEDPSGYDTKWHFTLVDTDGGLGGDVNGNYFSAIGSDTVLGKMMGKLMQNYSFKQRFFNRAVYAATTLFTSERVNSIIDDVVASMEKPMQASFTRWKAMGITEENWRNNITVMHEFADKRPEIFLNQLYAYTGMTCATVDIGFGGGGSIVTINGTDYTEGQRVYAGVSGKATELEYSVTAKDGFTIESIYYMTSDGTKVDLSDTSGTIYMTDSIVIFAVTSDKSTAQKINTTPVVEAGSTEVFYLNSNGYLYTWGYSESYAHGLGNFTLTTPVRIMTSVANVFTSKGGGSDSSQHTFVIMADGTVMSAGKNNCGQLGRDGEYRTFMKVDVPEGKIASISCGLTHTLLLMEDGRLYGVGSNTYGELGGNVTSNVSEWKLIASDVTSCAAGANITVYIKDGAVYALGDNDYNVFVKDAPEKITEPYKVAENAFYCEAADKSACYIDNSGVLYFFGLRSGEEAFGGTECGTVNRLCDGVISVSMMTDHLLILKDGGRLYGLGNNNYGQIDPSMAAKVYTEPFLISEKCIGYSAGASFTAYTTKYGTVITLGRNTNGVAGNGTQSDRCEKMLIKFN